MKLNFSLFHSKKLNPSLKPGKQSSWSLVGNDAFVDWSIILGLACLVATILIIVGGYLYIDTESQLAGPGNISPDSHAAVHFDAKKLQSTTSLFDARANETLILQRAYNGPRDPSLP
jgi:hypothetical protein